MIKKICVFVEMAEDTPITHLSSSVRRSTCSSVSSAGDEQVTTICNFRVKSSYRVHVTSDPLPMFGVMMCLVRHMRVLMVQSGYKSLYFCYCFLGTKNICIFLKVIFGIR